MTFPESIFSLAIDRALGWTVLHSIWQLTLLAMATALLLHWSSEKSAAWRYRLCSLALGSFLCIAVLTFFWMLDDHASAYQTVKSDLRAAQNQVVRIDSLAQVQTFNAPHKVQLRIKQGFSDYFEAGMPIVVLLWLMGLVLFIFRLMGALSYTSYLRRRMNFPPDAYWSELLEALCLRAGLKQAVELAESALVRTPQTLGHLKPLILFPIGVINRLTEQEVEAILAHEIAHILRHDYLVNVFQSVVEAIFYYHPAVWWLSAQVRNERESACDDMAIALLGNKLNYAKALVTMQEMAYFPLSPALAFAGQGKKQLLSRVQRLFAHNNFKMNVMEKWIATGLVVCSILALAIGQHITPSASLSAEVGDPNKGVWQAEFLKDSVCITLSGGKRDAHWSYTHGDCFSKQAFNGLNTDSKELRFSLERPAGQMRFTGIAEGIDAYGRFEFTPNQTYVKELEVQGIRVEDESLMYHLFWANFPANYIQSIKKEGIENIDADKLSQLAIFNIGLPQVREYADLNRKMGGTKLDADKIVELKIANVTPEQASHYAQSGYPGLDLEELSQLSLHEVSPEFIAQMNAQGFGKLEAEALMSAKIHGLTPEFIQSCRKIGGSNLSFDDVIAMRIHNITPEFIATYNNSGLGELSIDDILAMRIHNITPEFIATCKKSGLGELSMDDIMAMRIHDITPEFIESCKNSGLGELSMDDIMAMRIHHITPEYVSECKNMGLGARSFDDIIAMRIHHISPDFVKTYRDLGFKNLSFDELVAARIHNITPEFIKKAEEKGYKFPDLEGYNDLKIREMTRVRRTE